MKNGKVSMRVGALAATAVFALVLAGCAGVPGSGGGAVRARRGLSPGARRWRGEW